MDNSIYIYNIIFVLCASSNPVMFAVTLHPLPGFLQVTYEYKIGNYEKAKKASRKALYLNLAAFFSGIALWIIVVVGAACYLFYNTFLRD